MAVQDFDIRMMVQRELGQHRASAPGLLRAWGEPDDQPVRLKEVIAIIRPGRWWATKARLQRLRLPAYSQQRVLGRGRERGLRYLPRRGASARTAVTYLPKRMVTWIVEEPQVAPLIDAIIEENRTGQIGDGVIFVLPVDEAVRVRTGERGADALRVESSQDLWGAPVAPVCAGEASDAPRQ